MESIVNKAYRYAMQFQGQGKPADYIPELAKADLSKLAVCITKLGGKTQPAGDSQFPFTIQSISKLIALATALQDAGEEDLFEKVGMEPSGDAFNSIVRLETFSPMPLNPMINAGAIVTTSFIKGSNPQERFNRLLERARLLLDNPKLTYDKNVFASESATGDRNRALAYMMKANGVLNKPVDETLEVYFKSCSILATCEEISYFGAVLANDGVSPKSGVRLIDAYHVKIIRSLMFTCGMYDDSGKFALRVGIPAKSGVGGGILGVVPNRMGIGVFSPQLDEKGNSYCGIRAMEFLSQALNLSIF